MDGTFVKELAARVPAPAKIEVNKVEHLVLPGPAGEGWKLADVPKPAPEPKPLTFGTLVGFVGYVIGNRDSLEESKLMVHVVGPRRVELLEPLTGAFRQRPLLAAADLDVFEPKGFPFGQWLDMESFVIGLQASFVATEARDDLLRLIGNVKDEAVRQTSDDGVTQTVVAKQGAALVAEVPVPNPVTLAPYRTFREVEQPESRFILRLRSGGPTCALFEADGGAWKIQAANGVTAWLRDALRDTAVAVIA